MCRVRHFIKHFRGIPWSLLLLSKFGFGLILVAAATAELAYILTVTNDDGVVLFYPVTVVAAIVNLVR